MNIFMMILELVIIGIGAIFLARSLIPIRSLIMELPHGSLKSSWKSLSLFILFFIVCYFVFAFNLWLREEDSSTLSVGVSFTLLFGGIFAFLVGKLALQTMIDIKHIAILQHESVTDPLMGIKNRRYFDQKICEEVALSKRYKLPLSLILLDIDNFKKINDTYGHKIGDEVLKNIASLILGIVRDTDVAARYGGEEIVIVMPNSGKAEAELLAERLRSIIEKTTVATIDTTQEVVQVTVSMGICSMSHVITDRDALIEEADEALYLAKKQGRNRVVCSNW